MTATAASLAAAGLAGFAAMLLLPGAPTAAGSVARRGRGDGLSQVTVLTAAGVGAMIGWSFLSPHTFALATILAVAAAAVTRMVRRRRAAVAADLRADQVLAVCESMASDLAAGQPPLAALDRAANEWPDLAPAAVAARLGADVPTVLRGLARRPGAGQLRTLAASWYVAHDAGSGLAPAIGTAAASIRAERRIARLVASELASARATARMLATLPFLVLLLGLGVGGDPIGFLLRSPFGLVCLAAGLALSLAGLRWLDHIADRVLRR